MSAKWRRSTKSRKWLDLNDSAKKVIKTKPKTLRIETIKPTKSVRSSPSFRTPKSFSKRKFVDPKPLIDIFQENNWITIVAEIAGFNKESFKINVKDQLFMRAEG